MSKIAFGSFQMHLIGISLNFPIAEILRLKSEHLFVVLLKFEERGMTAHTNLSMYSRSLPTSLSLSLFSQIYLYHYLSHNRTHAHANTQTRTHAHSHNHQPPTTHTLAPVLRVEAKFN